MPSHNSNTYTWMPVEMRTLYAHTLTSPTSPACWRHFKTPCLPVMQPPSIEKSRRRSYHPRSPPHLKPRTVSTASGDFFTSEVVQRDFERFSKDLTTLMPMMEKFPDFDLEGKRMFVQQLEECMERFRIINTRMKLSEDPRAKGMLHHLNVQMLEANISMESMFEGFQQQVEMMRSLLEEEERTADPAKLQALREAARAVVGGSNADVGSLLLPNLAAGADLTPEDFEAIRDPKALMALNELAEDPLALEKYRDRPALYRLLKKLTLGRGS